MHACILMKAVRIHSLTLPAEDFREVRRGIRNMSNRPESSERTEGFLGIVPGPGWRAFTFLIFSTPLVHMMFLEKGRSKINRTGDFLPIFLRIGKGVGKQGYGNRSPIDDRNPIRKFSIDCLDRSKSKD